MKKGLMVQFPCARGRAYVCKNIGDYIQSVASKQYVKDFDEYVDQEEAYQYYPEDKQKIKLIMNGWFQWRTENWPPSEYIEPLLISMHIAPFKAKELLTSSGIEFLKKNGPVGCRDLGTKRILQDAGIDAYYSGCLTLTLGNTYKVDKSQREGYCFVDPYFDIPDIYENGKLKLSRIISILSYSILHFRIIKKLGKKQFFKEYSNKSFLDRNEKWYWPYYKATLFYKDYRKKFERKILENAEYILHFLDVDMVKSNNDELMNSAERLIKKYASAKLVVTSRIHAGLPCLGLETPVIFVASDSITSEKGDFNTPGRLEGNINLFRVLEYKNGKWDTSDEFLANVDKITTNIELKNKDEWKPIAEKLHERCRNFME